MFIGRSVNLIELGLVKSGTEMTSREPTDVRLEFVIESQGRLSALLRSTWCSESSISIRKHLPRAYHLIGLHQGNQCRSILDRVSSFTRFVRLCIKTLSPMPPSHPIDREMRRLTNVDEDDVAPNRQVLSSMIAYPFCRRRGRLSWRPGSMTER